MKYLLLILIFILPIQALALDRDILIDEINDVRVEHGSQEVEFDPVLNWIAYEKANDMVYRNYWAHSYGNDSIWKYFWKYQYPYLFAGEIIVKDARSERQAIKAWMNSPTHKAVIVNPIYSRTGIATVRNITVEVFSSV